MNRLGMTLIEALACVLLLTVGVLAILALVLHGTTLAARAQAASTGMATALTVLYDPAPLGFTPDANTTSARTRTIAGYLNGYFVRRTRVREADLASAAPAGSAWQACTVTVEVYQGADGTPVTTLRQRLLERIPAGSEAATP